MPLELHHQMSIFFETYREYVAKEIRKIKIKNLILLEEFLNPINLIIKELKDLNSSDEVPIKDKETIIFFSLLVPSFCKGYTKNDLRVFTQNIDPFFSSFLKDDSLLSVTLTLEAFVHFFMLKDLQLGGAKWDPISAKIVRNQYRTKYIKSTKIETDKLNEVRDWVRNEHAFFIKSFLKDSYCLTELARDLKLFYSNSRSASNNQCEPGIFAQWVIISKGSLKKTQGYYINSQKFKMKSYQIPENHNRRYRVGPGESQRKLEALLHQQQEQEQEQVSLFSRYCSIARLYENMKNNHESVIFKSEDILITFKDDRINKNEILICQNKPIVIETRLSLQVSCIKGFHFYFLNVDSNNKQAVIKQLNNTFEDHFPFTSISPDYIDFYTPNICPLIKQNTKLFFEKNVILPIALICKSQERAQNKEQTERLKNLLDAINDAIECHDLKNFYLMILSRWFSENSKDCAPQIMMDIICSYLLGFKLSQKESYFVKFEKKLNFLSDMNQYFNIKIVASYSEYFTDLLNKFSFFTNTFPKLEQEIFYKTLDCYSEHVLSVANFIKFQERITDLLKKTNEFCIFYEKNIFYLEHKAFFKPFANFVLSGIKNPYLCLNILEKVAALTALKRVFLEQGLLNRGYSAERQIMAKLSEYCKIFFISLLHESENKDKSIIDLDEKQEPDQFLLDKVNCIKENLLEEKKKEVEDKVCLISWLARDESQFIDKEFKKITKELEEIEEIKLKTRIEELEQLKFIKLNEILNKIKLEFDYNVNTITHLSMQMANSIRFFEDKLHEIQGKSVINDQSVLNGDHQKNYFIAFLYVWLDRLGTRNQKEDWLFLNEIGPPNLDNGFWFFFRAIKKVGEDLKKVSSYLSSLSKRENRFWLFNALQSVAFYHLYDLNKALYATLLDLVVHMQDFLKIKQLEEKLTHFYNVFFHKNLFDFVFPKIIEYKTAIKISKFFDTLDIKALQKKGNDLKDLLNNMIKTNVEKNYSILKHKDWLMFFSNICLKIALKKDFFKDYEPDSEEGLLHFLDSLKDAIKKIASINQLIVSFQDKKNEEKEDTNNAVSSDEESRRLTHFTKEFNQQVHSLSLDEAQTEEVKKIITRLYGLKNNKLRSLLFPSNNFNDKKDDVNNDLTHQYSEQREELHDEKDRTNENDAVFSDNDDDDAIFNLFYGHQYQKNNNSPMRSVELTQNSNAFKNELKEENNGNDSNDDDLVITDQGYDEIGLQRLGSKNLKMIDKNGGLEQKNDHSADEKEKNDVDHLSSQDNNPMSSAKLIQNSNASQDMADLLMDILYEQDYKFLHHHRDQFKKFLKEEGYEYSNTTLYDLWDDLTAEGDPETIKDLADDFDIFLRENHSETQKEFDKDCFIDKITPLRVTRDSHSYGDCFKI